MRRRAGLILAAMLAAGAAGAEEVRQCRTAFDRPLPALNLCADARRVSVAAVGDVLLHSPLQRQGYQAGFGTVWGQAVPWLSKADVAYANFEGASAPGYRLNGFVGDPGPVFDGVVHTSYPLFNYHPRAAEDLRAAGVDVVSTANNHALDRLSAGADATLATLAAVGLVTTGTIRRGAPRDWEAVTPSDLGDIVWIACSYGTNGVPDPGRQVLLCYGDSAELIAAVRAAAARPGVAAVIVTPHWGQEYAERPDQNQRSLARALVAAGATAVIGAHPHVVQPWEAIAGPAGQVPVIYSLGNFVSGQPGLARETGMIAWLELCRAAPGADLTRALGPRLTVAGAGWIPTRMARTAGGRALIVAEGDHVAPARALIERLVPGFDAGARLVCETRVPMAEVALQ